MLGIAAFLFWLSLFVVFYTYAGYPLLLVVLNKFQKNGYISTGYGQIFPEVTIIIAAYDEGPLLREKIENTLALDYPDDKKNIIIITDGSSDGSEAIAADYSQVQVLHQPERGGKLAAMNRAMDHVQTEIVVFSDANTLLNRDCLEKLVAHYADEKVGAVSGEKKIRDAAGVAKGEGAYWKYESFLKRLDSRWYSVVGAAGELFSMRKSLYTTLPDDTIIEDFVQSLLVCRKGYLVRYEPRAFAIETASLDLSDERERKVRISAGGFQAMSMLSDLLNIFRYGRLSFLYISHRVLRWTAAPVALVVMLLASLFLNIYISEGIYRVVFNLQLIFYLFAILGSFYNARLFFIPYYFCFMNVAVFQGFLRHVRHAQPALWRKARRGAKI